MTNKIRDLHTYTPCATCPRAAFRKTLKKILWRTTHNWKGCSSIRQGTKVLWTILIGRLALMSLRRSQLEVSRHQPNSCLWTHHAAGLVPWQPFCCAWLFLVNPRSENYHRSIWTSSTSSQTRGHVLLLDKLHWLMTPFCRSWLGQEVSINGRESTARYQTPAVPYFRIGRKSWWHIRSRWRTITYWE